MTAESGLRAFAWAIGEALDAGARFVLDGDDSPEDVWHLTTHDVARLILDLGSIILGAGGGDYSQLAEKVKEAVTYRIVQRVR